MERFLIPDWLEQTLGLLLLLFVLWDVFLTVLYARMGIGFISYQLARLIWRFFQWVSQPFSHYRGNILSFCGPTILVLLVLVWSFALTLGTALIIHPELGTSIRSSNGETPTDFITAMYAGGSSMSIVGASDFTPHTSLSRMFYLFTSLIGMSVTSLTLTYLMQVYTALHRRNALGLKVHLFTAETGDAAEMLASLGPEGQFNGGYNNLSQLATDMAQIKESHHFYPVLFYFRFRDAYYSVSRFTLVSFDMLSLLKSTLDDKQYGWLKESGSVTQLWRASMLLVTSLENTFIPEGVPDQQDPPDAAMLDLWHLRYNAALRRLRQAGIQTIADEKEGFEVYVSLRRCWDLNIRLLAPSMAYSQEEIDPAGSNPQSTNDRQDFRTRLRSAG